MARRTLQGIREDRAHTPIHATPNPLLTTCRVGRVTLLTFPDRYPTGQRGPRLITAALHDGGGAWLQHGTPGRLHRLPLTPGPDAHKADAYAALTRTAEAFFDAAPPDPPRLSLHALTLAHPAGATVRFTHQGVSGTFTVHHGPPVPEVRPSCRHTFGDDHVDAALHALHLMLSEDAVRHYLHSVRTVRAHLHLPPP